MENIIPVLQLMEQLSFDFEMITHKRKKRTNEQECENLIGLANRLKCPRLQIGLANTQRILNCKILFSSHFLPRGATEARLPSGQSKDLFPSFRTSSSCFDVVNYWLMKEITNTFGNHFSRSKENRCYKTTIKLRCSHTRYKFIQLSSQHCCSTS